MKTRYSFTVQWSDEDGEYMALCPAFPGLSAFGKTPQEAVREGTIALRGFIKSHEIEGDPLPLDIPPAPPLPRV